MRRSNWKNIYALLTSLTKSITSFPSHPHTLISFKHIFLRCTDQIVLKIILLILTLIFFLLLRAPVARFCFLSTASSADTPRVSWDPKRIRCSLSKEELSDELLLRNLVHGTMISGKFWPVLFDSADRPHTHFRSIPFFQQAVGDPSLLRSLDEEQRAYLMVGVRDLWLADSQRALSPTEHLLLLDLLALIGDDDCFPTADLRSMSFSLCPTRNRRVLRFIEHLAEIPGMDADLVECAAQMAVDTEGRCAYAVWVDARDLSYHNFECILPLDRVLSRGETRPAVPIAAAVLVDTERKRKTRSSSSATPSPAPWEYKVCSLFFLLPVRLRYKKTLKINVVFSFLRTGLPLCFLRSRNHV